MIRYFKLFDLLNRRGMKKSDLREILSPKTVAKLSKGGNVETDVIDKICLYLGCQPGDIMEVVEMEEVLEGSSLVTKARLFDKGMPDDMEPIQYKETYFENRPSHLDIAESDELGLTNRTFIDSDNPLE